MLMRVSIFLFLFVCNVSLSHAGLFSDSKAREDIATVKTQVEGMEARVEQMEAALKSQALLELYTQVETLGLELGELRGQIELLNNQNELLQKRQRDFYIDLDSRVRQIEDPNAPPAIAPSDLPTDSETTSSLDPALVPAPAPTPALEPEPEPESAPELVADEPLPVVSTQPASPLEKSAYNEAYRTFSNGDYNGAISQFGMYLTHYSSSILAPGAAYWVGNAHYALRDFQQAVDAQRKLIETYPDSDKVPDALLNIASSQIEMADRTAAKATLEDLIAKYPFSDAAEKAKLRLANL